MIELSIKINVKATVKTKTESYSRTKSLRFQTKSSKISSDTPDQSKLGFSKMVKSGMYILVFLWESKLDIR